MHWCGKSWFPHRTEDSAEVALPPESAPLPPPKDPPPKDLESHEQDFVPTKKDNSKASKVKGKKPESFEKESKESKTDKKASQGGKLSCSNNEGKGGKQRPLPSPVRAAGL